jgi:hypothetical protein
MKPRVQLIFVVLGIAIGTSMACRDRGSDTGIGGQSGDEGRRMSWIGNGGTGARPRGFEPPPER